MSRIHLAVVFCVSLLVLLSLAGSGGTQIIDNCNMTASATAGVLFSCPQGDGDDLASKGLTITVSVRDQVNVPIAGVPATDIWLIGCSTSLSLCGGSAAINASAPTDANGITTITGQFATGGCDESGVRVVVMGFVVGSGVCGQPCVPVKVRSCDLDGNLAVNLIDFSTFGTGYQSPPKAYNACLDFVVPFGTVTLADYAKYGAHSSHHC